MGNDQIDARVLERLFAVIESRRGAVAASSYTAKLFDRGREAITGKISEEAAEVVEAALGEGPQRLASESADLLYHLLVLWADGGIRPEDVWAELERRQGTSGLEEKASRSNRDE